MLRKSKVISVVGPDAFDYGLLIGHEDAHRLIRDETADIFITFPHRSLQEFLGSFFFVPSLLNHCRENEDILQGTVLEKPIFMENPLFLKCSLWFVNNDKHQNLEKSSKVCKRLQNYCTNIIYDIHLNTKHIAEKFPALDIASALRTKDKLRVRFLRGIISNCTVISRVTVESSSVLHWVLKVIASALKNVIYIKCNETEVHLGYFPENQIVLRGRKLSFAADLYVILKHLKVHDLSVHLHLENPTSYLNERQVGLLRTSRVEYSHLDRGRSGCHSVKEA